MTIGSIPGGGYMYNSYAASRIPSVDPAQVRQIPEKQADKLNVPAAEPKLQDIPLESGRPDQKPMAVLEDISLTFNKEETFDYIGSDSDIAGLDMAKAISDMKKDSILQDYSYFVGTAPGSVHSISEDGVVIAK